MSGIVEVIDHLKRQVVTLGQPFDELSRATSDGIDEVGVHPTVRLAPDIGGKQLRVIGDGFRRWNFVPAAGMSPADSAVEPAGTASRSITIGSMPASFALSAAHRPAAPAPRISSGTRVWNFSFSATTTALIV